MAISREKFEKDFAKVNASWAYENAALNEIEKELLFKRLNGELTDEEFNAEVMKAAEKK